MENLPFKRSAELHAESSKYLAMGVSSGIRNLSQPILFFKRADGPYYYDVDGHEFIDYTLAWGPLILGSNHPKLNEAVAEQLKKSYTFGAQHRLELELAKVMVNVIPGAEQVIFSNTGSEAVQAAIRIAKAYTGRKKVIKFEGHYHGWFSNVLVSYHPEKEYLGQTMTSTGGQYPSDFVDVVVIPWNNLEALRKAFEDHPDEVACVIGEPLLANSGSCMPQEGFLEGMVSLCKDHGALSIFDEVITGFRIALGGAREYFRVIPDISVYAKAMAGGFTMAALASTREIFSVLTSGKTIHAGTYNGTSHNLAAAFTTIKALSEEGVFERMHEHGYALREHITLINQQLGIPLVMTGLGSVWSLHFGPCTPPINYEDTLMADAVKYQRFRMLLLDQGVYTLPDGRWYIGASHTSKELEKTKSGVAMALQALEKPDTSGAKL